MLHSACSWLGDRVFTRLRPDLAPARVPDSPPDFDVSRPAHRCRCGAVLRAGKRSGSLCDPCSERNLDRTMSRLDAQDAKRAAERKEASRARAKDSHSRKLEADFPPQYVAALSQLAAGVQPANTAIFSALARHHWISRIGCRADAPWELSDLGRRVLERHGASRV